MRRCEIKYVIYRRGAVGKTRALCSYDRVGPISRRHLATDENRIRARGICRIIVDARGRVSVPTVDGTSHNQTIAAARAEAPTVSYGIDEYCPVCCDPDHFLSLVAVELVEGECLTVYPCCSTIGRPKHGYEKRC